jgi:hypothetical protein
MMLSAFVRFMIGDASAGFQWGLYTFPVFSLSSLWLLLLPANHPTADRSGTASDRSRLLSQQSVVYIRCINDSASEPLQ